MRSVITGEDGAFGFALIDNDGYYVDGAAPTYETRDLAATAASARASELLTRWQRQQPESRAADDA